MKKIVKWILTISLIFVFAIQFCACKTQSQSIKSNNLQTKGNNANKKIQLNLGSGNSIVINLNEKINEEILSKLNIDELTLLRYAYYAKYDYEFADSSYVEYFDQYSWYEPINKNVDDRLTLNDKENIALVKTYEKKLTSSSLMTPSTTQSSTQDNSAVQNSVISSHEIHLRLSNDVIVTINLDKRISEELLWQLTSDELSYIRNGYYAKHGYIFSKKKYSEYFSQYTWYKAKSKNVENSLTKLDKENVAKILEYEKSQDTVHNQEFDVGIYYIWLYLNNGNAVIVDLDEKINESLLWELNSDELGLLRNAYYAKNGYIFSNKTYSNFFSQYSWYYPVSKNVESNLSKIDKENIALVKKYEN